MKHSPRLLIVDDDAGIRETLRDILQEKGFAAVAVSSGREAIRLCNENSFSVVLVDIKLDDMSGPDIVKSISTLSPETEYIYITGHASLDTAIEAIKQEQIISYEVKPLDPDRLISILEQVMKRKEAESQLRKAHEKLALKVRERTRELGEAIREKDAAKLALDAIFFSIPDGILTVDPEMRVLQKNKVLISGHSIETGRVLDPGKNQYHGEFYNVLRHTLKTKKPVRELRVELKRSEGGKQVLILNTAPLLNSHNSFIGALLIIRDISELAALEEKLLERERFRNIVGKSRKMQEVYDLTTRLADVDTTILITGESGTGKELIVETLHHLSPRSLAPLVRVNCSALHENLLESELFGHIQGSFTGAIRDREGRIEMAESGILFLDEIGEISSRIQLQLLRFLESREYERVGESQTKKANVQVVTATNLDLADRVRTGQFREDLYYRLKVMVINLPPLRERSEDIPLLTNHFISMFNSMYKKTINGAATEVLKLFMEYTWPGNVRELKHVVEHACIICPGDLVEPVHLPGDFFVQHADATPEKISRVTREDILAMLDKTDWNMAKTARRFGMSRATLYNKLKQHEIKRP